MQNTFRKIIAPPSFPEDKDKSRVAYYLHFLVLFSMPALLMFQAFRLLQGNSLFGTSSLVLLSLLVVLSMVWILMNSGAVHLASYTYIGTIWIASTLLALNGNGIRGLGFASYFVVMLLAGLLLGVRAAVAVAAVSVVSGFGLALTENIGIIKYAPSSAFAVAEEYAFLFFLSTLFLYLIMTSLQNALTAAKVNSIELENNNHELISLRDALELRIHERTLSLEKRAAQMQAVSSMARTIAAVQDLSALLPNITNLVSEQFGFYHSGIFLVDDEGKYAVLKASNSEGGRQMLNRDHRLLLDTHSIVGYVTSRGEP
ncbi:MAG TPA: hypothetical protein VK909_12955, partial [Anaerolineales bacterium]|nr:hypothetical protein [Anaerolineales bacterium]